jgi:DNA-binding NtrC family response regulator
MRSPAMRRIDRVLRAVAPKDVVVTLVGESGSGKEVLARRIHEMSDRSTGPFVPINCAAIPEALFESELFGHERGAFTGASERVKGKVESAQGGTLFLDEIGDMPLGMQTKVLRFLENRRFMRVGSSTKLEADVRLVFATLRPLEEEVRAARFRVDLYYRVQGITVRVPPLRERRADIPKLVEQFLRQLSARHRVVEPTLSRSARAALLAYAWPGNVRELRNVLEMLCLLRAGRQIRERDLPPLMRRASVAAAATADGAGEAGAPGSRSLTLDLDQPLDRIVDRIIDAALALEGGNRSRAAERLGVSVRTIQRYLARGGSAATVHVTH